MSGLTPEQEGDDGVRKVVAVEMVSLDGVVESPNEWAFQYSDDEMERENAAGMAASDALLLGRKTYEEFAAFWPHQPGGTPLVDYVNSVPKHVVSGTLEGPLEWNNSVPIPGDAFAERIAELKREPGKNITVVGSIVLVRSLHGAGLLDELRLTVYPVVLGGGRRLFEDWKDSRELQLVDSRAFGTGAVSLAYSTEGR